MNIFLYILWKLKGLLRWSQEPATGPYLVLNECSSLFSNPWCAFVGLFTTQFIICIRILLICHTWDQTVTRFWNILDYHAVSGLNQVLTSNSVLLFLYLGRTANQRSISFGCIHLLLVQWHQVPFFFLGGGLFSFYHCCWKISSLYSWRSWWLGGKRSEDNSVEYFSRLATIFLKYASIRVSRISAS